MKISITIIAVAAAAIFSASFGNAGDMKHGDHANHDAMVEQQVGDLMLKSAFTRATLPNQPVAGGYLTITNMGDADDTLIGVSTPLAAKGEVHEMAMSGDTMKMRKLDDGLVIPAGESVELKPGGYHLMFMKLSEPLVEGEMLEVTLEFEKAGSAQVMFSIESKGAKSMDHSGHGS